MVTCPDCRYPHNHAHNALCQRCKTPLPRLARSQRRRGDHGDPDGAPVAQSVEVARSGGDTGPSADHPTGAISPDRQDATGAPTGPRS
jgi:hypothetical protein